MSLQENTQGKIIKRAIILTLIIIGVIFLGFKNPTPHVYGIIFGSSINILNFRLMALNLEKAVKMAPARIMPFIMGNYMLRYTIYGLVLAIAAKADYINLYFVILGFFMVKFVVISDTFYDIIRGIGKKSLNR